MAKLVNKHTSGSIVGAIKPFAGSTAPAGTLLCDGKTIGNASSAATSLANNKAYALFVQLWNSFANTELPVSGGRGASADADWAANKTITLPDLRGRIPVGKDNLGGTQANTLTSGNFANRNTLGGNGGAETHTLAATHLPAHTHSGTSGNNNQSMDHRHSFTWGNLAGDAGYLNSGSLYSGQGTSVTNANSVGMASNAGYSMAHTHSFTTDNGTGGGQPHNNVQPSLVMGYIIAYI